MNEKEAIKILKRKIQTMEDGAICCDFGIDKEVFKFIIKKLEQEPCEDCVSLKAVKEAIMKCETTSEDRMDCYIDSTTELEVEIDNLPLATPTRKKGKWIANHDESDDTHTIDCSRCGDTLVRLANGGYTAKMALDWFKNTNIAKNYCPSCGAEMESEEKQ